MKCVCEKTLYGGGGPCDCGKGDSEYGCLKYGFELLMGYPNPTAGNCIMLPVWRAIGRFLKII